MRLPTSRAAKIFRRGENGWENAGSGRCFGAGGSPAKMAGKMDAAVGVKALLSLALIAFQGCVGRLVCASCSRIVSASNRAIASCRRCKPADESRCPAAHPLGKPVGTRLLPAPRTREPVASSVGLYRQGRNTNPTVQPYGTAFRMSASIFRSSLRAVLPAASLYAVPASGRLAMMNIVNRFVK